MKTSAHGRAFITREEGLRLRAYQCPAGIWTIGVGHTSAAGSPHVTPDLTITKVQADSILARDLAKFEAAVNRVARTPVNQNEFDAMVSLAFNIGEAGFARSSVARLLNAGHRSAAADAFLLWKKAGNNPSLLLPRRKRERALFLGKPHAAEPLRPAPADRDDPGDPAPFPPDYEPPMAREKPSVWQWLKELFR